MGKLDQGRSRRHFTSKARSVDRATSYSARIPHEYSRSQVDTTASGHDVGAHGSLLMLRRREMRSAATLEPLAPDLQLPLSGSLALLEAPAPELAAVPRPVAVRRHILLVEDDPLTAGVVCNALELEGDPDWGVAVAGEGMRALQLAASTPPDVVLLDVRLPGLDGGEVYRRLRASRPTGHARVLFLTAGTSLDLYHRGIDDGVLLRKPFDVQELVSLVRALLAE
jgi:CheY-like chemotaxis protein